MANLGPITTDAPQPTDTRLCRGCGYDLHGLPEPRCPECSRDFDPQNSATYVDKIYSGLGFLSATLIGAAGVLTPLTVSFFVPIRSGLRVPFFSVAMLVMAIGWFVLLLTLIPALRMARRLHVAVRHRWALSLSVLLGSALLTVGILELLVFFLL